MARSDWMAAALVACTACDTPDPDKPDPAEVVTFECDLGFLGDDGRFVDFDSSSRAEMTLGFQGFLFVDARVRTTEPLSTADAVISIQVEGGGQNGATQAGVGFSQQADSTRLSDEVLIFLPTSNVAEHLDHTAELAIRVVGPDGSCVDSVTVLLVDDDPCIHTDDEPICPDDDTGAEEQ